MTSRRVSFEESPVQMDVDTKINATPGEARQVFTICTNNIEELSRVNSNSEVVRLTSEWPVNSQEVTDKKVCERVNNASKSDSDDDLVLVTDKSTQTGGLVVPQKALSVHQISSSPSHYQVDTEETSKYQEFPQQKQQQQQSLSENELIINDQTDNSLEKQASEAPTLRVEYVSKVWDAYIDDFLLGCDHIDEAAIFDIATKRCIACSSDFAMDSHEFDHLARALTCLTLAYNKGVAINGHQYKTVLADGKRGLMAKSCDRGGFSACCTRTLIIIAMHGPSAKSRICNEELMNLGDFFWVKGL